LFLLSLQKGEKTLSVEDLKKALGSRPKAISGMKQIPSAMVYEKWFDAFELKFSVFQKDYERMQKDWAKDRDAMFDYLTEAEELKREIKAIKIENVVVPRADYDLQVHVPHKQLEDFDKDFPSINSHKYYVNGTLDYKKWATAVIQWRGKYQDFRFSLLNKELLEARI
jgi:hypothetical protein